MPEVEKFKITRKPRVPGGNWRGLQRDFCDPQLGDTPTNPAVIAAFIHLSDLHLCDASSPARLEFLDRIADPDNPLSAQFPYIGTYRAQEFLTTHVLEAMVQAANLIERAPLTGAPIDAVVITGDVTDNAQLNELNWYKTILDGGLVHPKSAELTNSDGPYSSNKDSYDIHYYHPDGPPTGLPSDRPNTLHGFPQFKGVEAAAEKAFVANGLKHKWLAVHGNHDALLQGTAAPTQELTVLAQGANKLSGIKDMSDLETLFTKFDEVGPADYPGIDALETKKIVPDQKRALVKIQDWVEVHTNCGHDHGLVNEKTDSAYWYRDINDQLRLVALDTVNEFGGWQGCIDREQFNWLQELLQNSKDKYIVLTSHHPLETLFNGYTPDGVSAPALIQEVGQLIAKYPNVILWFSGHVHKHRITQNKNEDGSHGFWEIRTASHIDWPQQSRVIEIVKTEGNKIAIGTTVFDHVGPIEFNATPDELSNPVALAGLSRLLASNDWQRQGQGHYSIEEFEGSNQDRNIWLWADDPLK